MSINQEQRSVQGLSPGNTILSLRADSLPFDATTNISVTNEIATIRKLDPIVASVRLSLVSDPADERLGATDVSLQIRSGLFFNQERAEVTASVVLNDGRRVVIDDSSLLQIKSSNESIVSVEDNFIIAQENGVVSLNVSFVVCGRQLSNSIIEVTVEFDQHRPIFEEDTQDAQIIENSPVGSSVTTVGAVDMDFAANEQSDTEYRFKDESSSFGGLWVIDTITGVISLNGPIDRETRDSYELVIEATDRLQRQAEAARRNQGTICNGGSGVGSGSGGGSGCDNGLLVPDNGGQDPDSVTPEVDVPDTLTVSCML